MLTRRSFIAAGASGAVVLAAGGGRAEEAGTAGGADAAAAAAQAAKRRINVAGRQRMLTQRMAKAACFVFLGVETERHLAQMGEAHALFASVLQGLRYGDNQLGLTRETHLDVNIGLGRVAPLWETFGSTVAASVAAGSVARPALDEIIATNLPIHDEMDRTVSVIQRTYGGRDMPLRIAVTINIAGRQRTLTQKMAKESGMIAAGYDPEATRAALAETVQLFGAVLTALREGMPMLGIEPPSNAEVRDQLAVVSGIWEEQRPVYAGIIEGSGPDAAALAQVAAGNDRLLEEMNKAVFFYEGEA